MTKSEQEEREWLERMLERTPSFRPSFSQWKDIARLCGRFNLVNPFAHPGYPIENADHYPKTIWVKSPSGVAWVLDSTGKVESHHPADRIEGPYTIHDIAGVDGSKPYLFWVVDSHFPQYYLVFADDDSGAYEMFVDYALEHCWLLITEQELPDYLDDNGEYCGDYDFSGNPVDTERIHMTAVTLTRLEF